MLILLWLAFPIVKGLHELAHALAVKAYGGDVHEVGVTLMLLTPMPYVDASASIAFEDKHKRIVVAAAGIVVELVLATVALALWLLLEPGLARDAAFAVAFIGGVSTLAVNGNPLLRFDGYHVLCDAFELPNLAPRSGAWWQAVCKRMALGPGAEYTETVHGRERAWLAAYAPASWAYRSVLTLTLALALADWSPMLGLALLTLALWWMLGGPLLGMLRWMVASVELHGRRLRALLMVGGAAAALVLMALAVPLPDRTLAPGVVWLPDEALVRPATDGFVEAVLVSDGQQVVVGTPLLRLVNEPLVQDMMRVESELVQQRIEQLAQFGVDTLRAAVAADRIVALEAEHQRVAARVAALDVRAALPGRVAVDARRLVPGQFLKQGQVAAHVLPPGAPLIRVSVSNDVIARVREQPGVIDVALAHDAGASLPAQWLRAVPRASTTLITPALGEAAGGPLVLDPSDKQGRRSLEPRFEVELRLNEGASAHVGARAWVTFRHGDASLVELAVQVMRRAFLRHFNR